MRASARGRSVQVEREPRGGPRASAAQASSAATAARGWVRARSHPPVSQALNSARRRRARSIRGHISAAVTGISPLNDRSCSLGSLVWQRRRVDVGAEMRTQVSYRTCKSGREVPCRWHSTHRVDVESGDGRTDAALGPCESKKKWCSGIRTPRDHNPHNTLQDVSQS
jgi:hypothetical protein